MKQNGMGNWKSLQVRKSLRTAVTPHAARRTRKSRISSPLFRAALFLASLPRKCTRRGCYGAPLLASPTLPPFPPSPPLSSLLHSVSPCCKRLQVSVQACSARLCLLPLSLLPFPPFSRPIFPYSSPPSPLLLLSSSLLPPLPHALTGRALRRTLPSLYPR
jgi:hypothetical protein